ncbi:ABC-type nickel/cobalt efflux system permease component RcnA [Novosphingobium capsulatum]|uniref:ABC-type nickel/cobalt efflux system permease component RcnA n=1 Tax=Novosphingobium capsulatum TaxID=13688 RepID=A0ABU1MM13_9SPHN|nr:MULTISPECIES: hypothetical protein [Novosphingobium]KPF54792.1 hypothetical protein IP65_08980 [Novosphingobium sp. AAP1]MDR6511067.1 ABC-type nickel/cobalt efflux system permease component RcnA [Novosphingobium capsulatum]PTR13063.1 hypothetical protein C8K11_10156 [Novosphingobium sp. GV055]PUB07282.1 hypothetical protein C8K12_10156 [Novosphingobium sp. GV061]PUB23095.1 hypothetical protein C8K14_10156 [Novosphingobium sp. GV079]
MSGWSQHFGWVEIVFTAAIAIGFGVWQLWSVNREIRHDRARKAEQERADASDDGAPPAV